MARGWRKAERGLIRAPVRPRDNEARRDCREVCRAIVGEGRTNRRADVARACERFTVCRGRSCETDCGGGRDKPELLCLRRHSSHRKVHVPNRLSSLPAQSETDLRRNCPLRRRRRSASVRQSSSRNRTSGKRTGSEQPATCGSDLL